MMLKWICTIVLLPCLAFSSPQLPGALHSEPAETALKPVFEGAYLSFYTSGRLLRQHRHPKSSVWNVPSRKVAEMWVKRTNDTELIRLDPGSFRTQLVDLLADVPEVHGAIRHRSFTYKSLPQQARELDHHISKVITIRRERARFRAK